MTIQLIVNADDYGYYPSVSCGIVDAAQSGAITATGIMANSLDLNNQLAELASVPHLDVGVHLNLTFGAPLTAALRDKLTEFPNAYKMSGLILTGKLSMAEIRAEWCAQIEACHVKRLMFLNSHEHIHMLPVLFALTVQLAEAYNIPHVRLTRAEWLLPLTGAALVRNSLMQAMQLINQRHLKTSTPLFLGLNRSGKLDYTTLARLFSKLNAGGCYELMCHPGYADDTLPKHLQLYHDWQAELDLLQSPELHTLYQQHAIRLSHYHHE